MQNWSQGMGGGLEVPGLYAVCQARLPLDVPVQSGGEADPHHVRVPCLLQPCALPIAP